LSQPIISETGIIKIQNAVSHPLIRRINVGSPCTDAQIDLAMFLMRSMMPRPLRVARGDRHGADSRLD
jgi:hypothetical protein